MQRVDRYPLEKENKTMMTTKAASWLKMTGSLEASTLQSIISGMKTRRDSTAAGNRMLSFPGYGNVNRDAQKWNLKQEVGKAGRLTHCTTDTVPWPSRSMMLKTKKQQTQVKTLSGQRLQQTCQLTWNIWHTPAPWWWAAVSAIAINCSIYQLLVKTYYCIN